MSTPEQRLRLAAKIVDFKARRDNQHRVKVYFLPASDGGGAYEVAGINVRYHPEMAARLRALVEGGQQDQAEQEAAEYIATYTDGVAKWTSRAAVECYLRDCAFNRGPGGAARILQRALGVEDDGHVGPMTQAAVSTRELDPSALLDQLRQAREEYEDDVAGPRPEFRPGLINRWNNALAFARTFL